MATIVEATVTLGDDKFTVVLDPRNLIRGWEDRTLRPDDFAGIWGAKVVYATCG